MQIVNGYVCMNCCDVDKARLGQDPHQSTDQVQKQIDRELHPLAPGNFGPAVTFGGSLQSAGSTESSGTGLYGAAPQSPENSVSASASSLLNLVV